MPLSNLPPLNGGGGGGGDVDSVFGRTGVVVAQSGDYTSDQVTPGTTNLFVEPIEVRNNTGSTLVKGTPVYVESTHTNGKANVAQASNDDSAKMPAVGVLNSDLLAGAEGVAIASGPISNVDTSSVSAGQNLYVGTDTGTSWTDVKPTGTALIQNMGYVIRSHATSGSFEVQCSGRTNDLPNILENYYWVGNASGVPTPTPIPSDGAFTKYTVNSGNTPFTIPAWGSVVEIVNDTTDIECILPTVDVGNQGKEIKFWVEHNTANHKLIIKAPSTSDTINGVANSGAEVARAEYSTSHENYFRITAQNMSANEVNIDEATSVYNELRYVANFSATSDFSPYSYLQLSAIPTNFLTSNASWWFAVKVETPMTNDSDGQVLFGSNNAFIAYRGNGTYFMTHSTSGYLQTISPNTIVESGEWILYQYDSATTFYTAWVNGVKVLNATSDGVTPPSTAPTNMWFGSEEGQALPPSGYGYPLQQCRISNISLGSGLLSDADAALFTSSTFDCPTLSGGTLTNQWKFAASDTITTETGSINLSIAGSNLSTEEI